jgi:hypothetical protein
MATNFPSSLDSLTNPTSSDPLNSPSHSAQHANANDAIEALQAKVGVDSSAVTTSLDYKVAQAATLTGTQTLTNKTLTAPVVNGAVLKETEETWNVSATAATGTVNMDVNTASAWYYTSNATANWTFNFRGDGSTTLASLLNTGDSITVAFAVTQGTTAYYASAFQIDGSSVTPKWQGGSAPTSGNASAIDLYTFTIVKTAATPTYTVFAARTKFA